jgi:hypothetical protein
MKKLTLMMIALTMCLTMTPIFAATAGNGRGPGGGGGGGGGGVCQNVVTTWDTDPDKKTMNAGQTGTYYLNMTNNCANEQTIKLQTTDTGMTFTPASVTLKVGDKTKVKVVVKMPAQNGRKEVWFTIKLVCSVGAGKVVKFRIRYTTAPCCNYVVAWVSNPNGKTVDSKAVSVFQLNVTNKCTDSISFKMSSTYTNVKFSKAAFTVAGGKTEKINVIVNPPSRRISDRIEYNVTVTSLCGTSRKLTFVLVYK